MTPLQTALSKFTPPFRYDESGLYYFAVNDSVNDAVCHLPPDEASQTIGKAIVDFLNSQVNHDERFTVFGELMWNYITDMGSDFTGDEWSESVLPLAQKAGLAERVEYNPEIHGPDIEAERGDTIWYWGENLNTAVNKTDAEI